MIYWNLDDFNHKVHKVSSLNYQTFATLSYYFLAFRGGRFARFDVVKKLSNKHLTTMISCNHFEPSIFLSETNEKNIN